MTVRSRTDKFRAFFRPASITFRLTWLYTLTAFCMLLIYAFFMYGSLVKSLNLQNTHDLHEEVNHLISLSTRNPDFLNQYLAMIGSLPSRNRSKKVDHYHYARVMDEDGHVVVQSPNYDALGLPTEFPAAAFSPEKAVEWKSAKGESFLLAAARVRVGNNLQQTRLIQVAKDVGDEFLIRDYHDKLLGSLVAGIFVCAAIGYSVARKTMRPLQVITEAAERITVSHIAERLDTERWPTELRTLAVAFNSMLDRLEQSIARLSQFSTDLAHELRTPINNLVGEAEIVITHGGTPEEFRRTLESSLEELGRLSRIIDSLLFLARAENQTTRLECTRFDARDEVQKLCNFYEWMAEEQGVTLTCSGNGFISADLLLVDRAVNNLISNALKYTSSPGKVEVMVRQREDGSTEITVRDTGLGIEQKDLPYLFDRFFRADSARSKRPQGTGLGLAIVKSIMDLHGGTIDIQSEPGLGTTATLWFPPHEDSKT